MISDKAKELSKIVQEKRLEYEAIGMMALSSNEEEKQQQFKSYDAAYMELVKAERELINHEG